MGHSEAPVNFTVQCLALVAQLLVLIERHGFSICKKGSHGAWLRPVTSAVCTYFYLLFHNVYLWIFADFLIPYLYM